MSATSGKQIVVIQGPAGSGKDSIAREILKRCHNTTILVTATTRAMRPTEKEGVNYYFLTNKQFKKEIKAGNILEHYYRRKTNTYYGTYKPDLEKRIASGKVVIAIIQIVGAKYIKEKYGATTFFIMPPSPDAFEKRIRSRAPISDVEWKERLEITKQEVEKDAPWYDYRIKNEDGKLDDAVKKIMAILKKKRYNLG